jgi:hypothetical protein
MNQLTTIPAVKATLVDIRTDNRRFPRLHTYRREDAIAQMNMIIMMAFQFRGQQADTLTIVQMSSSLVDILNDDEFGIGTKFLSFEEIKRVVRKAALGQGKEMYGISVSSLFQTLADYCKGEGRMADQQAKEVVARQRDLRNSIIAPMIEGHIQEMLNHSKK